jgi:hypothetical protein
VETLLLVGVVVVVSALIALGRAERRRRAARAATVSLVVDEWGVRRDLADGRHEEVAWAELQSVEVLTLPKGPWDDPVRFILDGGGERGCIVPRPVALANGLVEALSRLPGFDVRSLAEALDQPRPGQRTIWSRAGIAT